jgi:hypothetical protein
MLKHSAAFTSLIILLVMPLHAQQRNPIPAAWHQPLTQPEGQLMSRVIQSLKTALDYPHVMKYHPLLNTPLPRQINAWESNMEICLPVEMFRFVERDPSMLEFLLAHEAGHAKQQELYGQNCYTANNVQFSKFDWFGALAARGESYLVREIENHSDDQIHHSNRWRSLTACTLEHDLGRA